MKHQPEEREKGKLEQIDEKFLLVFSLYRPRPSPESGGRGLEQRGSHMLEGSMRTLTLHYGLPLACAVGLIIYVNALFWGLLPYMMQFGGMEFPG